MRGRAQVWVMLLGGFTTPFVYATLFSLPMAFLASAICLLVAGMYPKRK
jgi:hypothetical protein